MHPRIERWLDRFGNHIIVHGWSDPWASIPPLPPEQRSSHDQSVTDRHISNSHEDQQAA